MNKRKKWRLAFVGILSFLILLASGIGYIESVKRALWNKSVTDILEVTAQGRHALDTYIEKDLEMLHWLTAEISAEDPRDEEALQTMMELSNGAKASYLCINLDTGTVYSGKSEDKRTLDTEKLDWLRSAEGHGVHEPFLDDRTGVWTFGCYERFTWPDGTEGLVQKVLPLSEMAERFSLTFYNDTGFSYVVNQEGNILVRSLHRNSNRTMQNLFDIIDLQGNDAEVVQTFKNSLKNSQRGAAKFQYQDEDYVFCYVPLANTPDWYVISIVPNRVITEQTESIVQNSRVFLVLLVTGTLIIGAFFLLYSISARRIVLAEAKARKAAESANLAKSRFLSNMSHDIRTPMNAILGMTRLAMDHANEPEKVRDYLENVSRSGQLLVGLINDILDLSKIESGKMMLNQDVTSLEKLLTDLVKIIQPMAAAKNQKFDIRLHDVRHETLYFDALRLNQIMINLLSNAVKFTPQGGSVSVDVTELPSPRENCAHFRLRVTDTGIGIRPEFLEHIFDSFTREQDNRINQIEGSGLGMAITKMIVDMMEGTISVDSRPGEGSVFTVELDLPLPKDAPAEEAPLPRVRVLFADDDPATCRSAGEFLQELGMEAELTDNGRNAAEKAAEAHSRGEEYDLVLLDWKMPDLNGVEAARAIRRQTGYEVPIIVISAYDWTEIEEQAREAGVNGFIQKPFFKSTLSRCIRKNVFREDLPQEKLNAVVEMTGRNILLAEDNELNQEIMQALLAEMGALLDIAGNGQDCVDLFKKSEPGHYDLILMDVQMPVMNGYEATRKIRGLDRPDARTIPIFALTADAFAEDVAAAREAGMNSHLAKPLDVSSLTQEMQKYLR